MRGSQILAFGDRACLTTGAGMVGCIQPPPPIIGLSIGPPEYSDGETGCHPGPVQAAIPASRAAASSRAMPCGVLLIAPM
jgi:hypothetical protein